MSEFGEAVFISDGIERLLVRTAVQSAEIIEKGMPLSPEPEQDLQQGTSLGGARPKAQLEDGDKRYITKFSSTTDLYSVVKASSSPCA